MKENIFDSIKKILKIAIFISILITFIILLKFSSDDSKIKDIKNFINNGTKVLYISDETKYSEYPKKLFEKYQIDYLYVDSTNLNNFEKNKIEKLINSKYLSSIIVVYKDGKIVDAIIDFETEYNLNVFLQNLNIIPNVIGDISGIIDSANSSLNSDYSLLYLPYKFFDGMEAQSKILEEISEEYGITYQMINAYLLSFVQQEKLNSILQISSVDDQIIILVKQGKIFNSIRGINNKKEYLQRLKQINFIEDYDTVIEEINYKKFESLLKSDSKSIVIIGKDNCRYCEDVIKSLDKVSYEHEINIYYLNILSLDSDIASKLSDKLMELGYNDGLATPMTILIESNKLIDYIIGPSSQSYFIDIFKENGIIK